MSILKCVPFGLWLNLAANMLEARDPGGPVTRAVLDMNQNGYSELEDFLIMATQEAATGDNLQAKLEAAEVFLNKIIAHKNSRVNWDPDKLEVDDPVWTMRRRILGAVAVNFAGH